MEIVGRFFFKFHSPLPCENKITNIEVKKMAGEALQLWPITVVPSDLERKLKVKHITGNGKKLL